MLIFDYRAGGFIATHSGSLGSCVHVLRRWLRHHSCPPLLPPSGPLCGSTTYTQQCNFGLSPHTTTTRPTVYRIACHHTNTWGRLRDSPVLQRRRSMPWCFGMFSRQHTATPTAISARYHQTMPAGFPHRPFYAHLSPRHFHRSPFSNTALFLLPGLSAQTPPGAGKLSPSGLITTHTIQAYSVCGFSPICLCGLWPESRRVFGLDGCAFFSLVWAVYRCECRAGFLGGDSAQALSAFFGVSARRVFWLVMCCRTCSVISLRCFAISSGGWFPVMVVSYRRRLLFGDRVAYIFGIDSFFPSSNFEAVSP